MNKKDFIVLCMIIILIGVFILGDLVIHKVSPVEKPILNNNLKKSIPSEGHWDRVGEKVIITRTLTNPPSLPS